MTFRFLKIWKWIAGAIALAIIFSLWFNPPFAVGLFWSFVNSESSMAFWSKKMNLPFCMSFGIAMTCSGFEIFTWQCLFAKAKEFYYTLVSPLYRELERKIDLGKIDGKAEWIRTIYRFCCHMYTLLVPQPTKSTSENKTITRTVRRYVPLLAYGFVPTCNWTGVGYSFAFRLNAGATWCILVVGNAAKIASFGYFAVLLPFWSVLPIFIVGSTIIRCVVSRIIKRCD